MLLRQVKLAHELVSGKGWQAGLARTCFPCAFASCSLPNAHASVSGSITFRRHMALSSLESFGFVLEPNS